MIGSALPWALASADAEGLPDLPRGATYAIVLALIAIWLILRVQILRQRDRHQAEVDAPPVPAWRWLRWLAARRWTVPVLTVLALALLAVAGLQVVVGP